MDDIDPTKDYRKLLADLTHRGNNSKRLIDKLTKLAEDNETHAAKIVEVIETHLQQVESTKKLPTLYLIDSIIKNLPKSTYPGLFSHNIVSIFCNMFQQVDEETRKSMFEVRKTWDQHFTGRKMDALDMQVNIIDNEWPLSTSTSNISSIKHVNPTFLPQQRDESLPLPDLPPIEDDEAEMRRKLIAKHLKLQQKRLELELKETETRLAQQKKISADLFVGEPPMEFQSPIKEPRNLPHDADMRRNDCPPVFDDLRRECGPPRGTPLDRNREFDQRDRTRAAERPKEDMHTYRESDRPSHRGTDRPKDDRLSLRGQDRPPHVRGRNFDEPRRPSLLENNALFVESMLESLRSEHTPENSQDVPDKISKVDVTPITKNPPKPAVEDAPVSKLVPKPVYDHNKDDRWIMPGGGRMTDGPLSIFLEGTEEIVMNGQPFPIKLGGPKCMIVYKGEKLEVFIDSTRRMLHINGNIVYKVSDPVKEVSCGPGPNNIARVFYHGNPRNLWIDGFLYTLRIDAPPKIIKFRDKDYTILINGRDGMILINKKEVGSYGGKPRIEKIDGEHVELRFTPPPKSIGIDGEQCLIRLDRKIPFIIMKDVARGIRFDGPPREVIINNQKYFIPTDRAVECRVDNIFHMVAFGGPSHEIIIDGVWYELLFNGPPREITAGNHKLLVGLPTSPPDVKILDPIENQKLKDSDIDIKSSDRDRKRRSKRSHSGRSSPPLGQSGSQQTPVSILDLNVPKPPGLKKDMNNDRRRGSPLNEERSRSPVRHRDRRRRSPYRERRSPNRRGRRSPILKDDRGCGSSINDQSNFNGPRNMPPFGPGQQGPNPQFNPVGPNQPFPQRPNQPFLPNQQFSGPNQPPFQQGPNQRFSSGPNQMSFPVGPNQPFQPGPNQQFPPGPNQQFPQGPNQPMQQFSPGPRPPMQQDEGSQGLHSMFIPGPNQQFPSGPNVQSQPMQLIPPMQNMSVPSQPMPIMSQPPMPVLNQPIPAMSQSMPIPGQCMPGQTIPFIPSVSMMPVYSPELTEAQSRYDKTGLADLEEKLISSFANSDIWREGKQCIGMIQRMYSGKQCTSCSKRFMASQTKLYREHLDWHFRQNQREKKGEKTSRYRSWFYELMDWLDYEDVGDAEERGPNQQFPSGPNVQVHPMQLIPPMQNMPVQSQPMPIMSRPPMPVLNQPIPAMNQSMPIPGQCMPGQTIPFIPSVSMMPGSPNQPQDGMPGLMPPQHPTLQPQLNVESLLQKLIKAGLINANTDEAKETSENKEPVKDLQKKKEEDNSEEGKEKRKPVDGLDYEVGGDAQERVYSPELTEALSRYDETGLADMEEKLISSFSNGGNCGEWKEKTFFNYLLLDPRVTKDLPTRMNSLGDVESFKVFVAAIFYVGKGKRSRPFDHLKEAIRQMDKPGSDKVKRILDIWNKKKGVISLHCFQNVISGAAHTREACMIDAISLNPLTNQIRGSYYGISKTWGEKQRKNMGVYFLKRALQIFKGEGENQLFYDDILKVGQ